MNIEQGILCQIIAVHFLRKLKMELPFDLAIPLLGLYPKNPETPIQKNLCTPMFIAAQCTIAKCWKQPKCPSVSEWIKELWYIYTMEYYTEERKKELLPFGTAWMELESIMLSEISQVVKDKYHMISLRLITSFSPLWSEKLLDMISIFLNFLRLVLYPMMWSVFENVPCTFEKNVHFVSLG